MSVSKERVDLANNAVTRCQEGLAFVLPLIFHWPVTGQKYGGICSCSILVRSPLRTTIGSRKLSTSALAGVYLRTGPVGEER